MDRVFRVDFYPHEWISLTGHMTPVQKGIFIDIIAMIYAHRGRIKNDPSHIARVSNCSTRMATTIISQLYAQGDILLEGGFIGQKRAENELSKKRAHLEEATRGGRASAEKRSQSNKNNHISSSDATSSLPTTSPSPSPYKKESNPKGSLFDDLDKKDFEEFWTGWVPFEMSKGSKKDAQKSYLKTRKEIDHETLVRTRDQYLANCRSSKCKTKHASSWLNGRGWEDDDALRPITTSGASGYGSGVKSGKPTAFEIAMADRTHR